MIKFPVLALVALAGCQSAPQPVAPPDAGAETPERPPIVTRFDCDTLGLTATLHEARVVLELPERKLALPLTPSASGARFSDSHVTFWNKGREATLEIGGRKETCRERRGPWEDARDRGVDFRGVGQEPGWFIEIDTEKQIRFVYDYAEHEAAVPVPTAVISGGSTTYKATAGAHQLSIVIDDRPCQDVMSGEAFPRSVTVTIDGRTLHGCGQELSGMAGP